MSDNDTITPMSNLFQGTAGFYARFRPKYPEELFKVLVKAYDLNTSDRLLDIGCGTGQLTLPLASYVGHITALDPDQDMLREGEREAHDSHISNIEWRQGKAENINSDLGNFKLKTFGTCFHWLDAEDILKKAYAVTENGGGVAIIDTIANFWTDTTVAWKVRRRELIQKYLGEERRAGDGIYVVTSPEKFEVYLERSNFSRFQTWEKEWIAEYTIDSLLGNLYSMSFASQRLFGERLQEFETEFRGELLKVEPSGVFKDPCSTIGLLAWK